MRYEETELDSIRSWIEGSGYGRALGVQCSELSETSVTLQLPYADQNSNPGKALHGGCAASLGIIASQAVTRARSLVMASERRRRTWS